MKITKITIDNYKSIKHLEFDPNIGINAIIGENSVGKSNIFSAINLLLGPGYPSFNSITKADHFGGDFDNKISIRLDYDDKKYLELSEEWYDGYGNSKSGLNISGKSARSEDREKYCSAYLGTEREIQDYLPSNKWSLIGRILQQINEQFEIESCKDKNGVKMLKKELLKNKLEIIRDNVLFSVGRTSGNKDGLMDKFISILQKESAKQLNRDESEFSVDLSLYDPWNFYKTLQLIVKENDMNMTFQASSLGMGVQASITIAILKAYAELNLPNKTPIFIDEPELFLHPQAQRNFYNILREMSEDRTDEDGKTIEGLQIFYTTHSPNFLRTDKFNEIFIAKKNKKDGTYFNNVKVDDFIKDLENRTGIKSTSEDLLLRFKNAYEETGDSQKANEGFFAKKIILVEGQSETLTLPYLFGLLNFDYIKEGITIVRCGCKSEIDRFFRLYNEFGIPCYIIFDGDKQNAGTQDEKSTIEKNKEILSLFNNMNDWPDGSVNERYLGFENRLEDNLGFTVSDKTKSLKLFLEVRKNITGYVSIPGWVEEVVKKLNSLSDPMPSILDLS